MAVIADRPAERLSKHALPETPESQGSQGFLDPVVRPGWVKPTAVALTVVLAGFLALLGIFGSQAVGGLATEWGRSNVLGAAEDAAANLTTFDAGKADQDTQRFLDATSTNFARAFAGDQRDFIKSLRDGEVSMTGKVVDAGVINYTGDTARVLVAVRAQVSDTQSPRPKLRDYRMELFMVHEHGWKLDRIEFIA